MFLDVDINSLGPEEQVESEIKVSGSLFASITNKTEDAHKVFIQDITDTGHTVDSRVEPAIPKDSETLRTVEESTYFVPPQGLISMLSVLL